MTLQQHTPDQQPQHGNATANDHVRFSIIVPVFNRPDEVDELLDSLTRQTMRDFEVVIVEDGSQQPCEDVCQKYVGRLPLHYYAKANSGPGQSRNYGVERARGEYVIILDSDGIDSWKSWCVNCLQTERYKHMAYSSDFGIELDAAFAAETREEAESILTRQITEALLADPYERCEFIEDITFTWTASDALQVAVIIHGIDDVTIDVTAYLTKGES